MVECTGALLDDESGRYFLRITAQLVGYAGIRSGLIPEPLNGTALRTQLDQLQAICEQAMPKPDRPRAHHDRHRDDGDDDGRPRRGDRARRAPAASTTSSSWRTSPACWSPLSPRRCRRRSGGAGARPRWPEPTRTACGWIDRVPPAASDDALRTLAAAYGVDTEYHDWRGQPRVVEPDTLRAVLAALDVDASTDAACRAALADTRAGRRRPGAAAVPGRAGRARRSSWRCRRRRDAARIELGTARSARCRWARRPRCPPTCPPAITGSRSRAPSTAARRPRP